MPSICVAQLLVVTTGLCSALAGKAIADPTAPPINDSNHGEMLGQYIDTHPIVWHDGQYLDPVPQVGRGNESSALQLIWQDGRDTFNITMDSCLPMNTIVGIYQFANGTSKNDTTLYEISQDLLEFAYLDDDVGHRLVRFASQAVANAQLAVNDIIAFLDNHVLCGNVGVSGSDHNELRRLLVDPDDLADGYWAAVIMKGVAASTLMDIGIAVTGGTDSFNATFWHYAAGTILPFLGCIITGVVDRAQKTGKMNWLGALLGSAFSALTRRLVWSIDVTSECNSDVESNSDGLSLTSYVSAISEISSERCPT